MAKNINTSLFSTKEKSRSIWVRLSDEEFDGVREMAEKERLTIGQFVKKMFLEELDKKSFTEFKKISLSELLGPKTKNEPAAGEDGEVCSDQR